MSKYRILAKSSRRNRVCRECGTEYSPLIERGDVRCIWGLEVTHICWVCARELGMVGGNRDMSTRIKDEIHNHLDKGNEMEYIRIEDTYTDFVSGRQKRALGRYNDMGILRELKELTSEHTLTEEL